jgi:ABC-type molybdate transport system substrate-binding protein
MDYGQQKNLIKPDTRTNLLGNRIVLIAPKGSTVKVDIGACHSCAMRCIRLDISDEESLRQ